MLDLKVVLPAAFYNLEAAAKDWRDHQGEAGTFDRAGKVLELWGLLGETIGIGEAAQHRVHAAARGRDMDDPPEATSTGEEGELRGIAQFNADFAPMVFGYTYAKKMEADAIGRSIGDNPIIGRNIPRANRQQPHTMALSAGHERSILCAHYFAGLNGTSWLMEHAKIVGSLNEGGRNHWNRAVPLAKRELARAAGKHRRSQQPLSEPEREMEELVRQHGVASLNGGLDRLRSGGRGQ